MDQTKIGTQNAHDPVEDKILLPSQNFEIKIPEFGSTLDTVPYTVNIYNVSAQRKHTEKSYFYKNMLKKITETRLYPCRQ